MRTPRLAIICVADEDAAANSEVKGSGAALYRRYTELRPQRPTNPGKRKGAWAINKNNVLLVYAHQFGITTDDPTFEIVHEGANYKDRSAGHLGVYFLVHGMNGVTILDPPTVGRLLERFGLEDVYKMAFVSCSLAKNTDFNPGTEEKDKSFLFKLCKYLGEKGIKPKMAGWTDFITVVYSGMDDPANEDAVKKKVYKGQTEIDYNANAGKKAVKGRTEGTLSLVPSEQKRQNQKLCYVYQDGSGVARLAYSDWTEKPV